MLKAVRHHGNPTTAGDRKEDKQSEDSHLCWPLSPVGANRAVFT